MTDAQLDFLTSRGSRAIKQEIQSIVDSYHHYWDPLAELLQNSRDAIHRSADQAPNRRHFIRVLLDANTRRIEVLDNGVGIPQALVAELLGPGGGDKWEFGSEVGEKGVGLTYSIFSSDEFRIESRNGGEHHGGSVKGARSWRENPDHKVPPPKFEVASETDLTESAESIDINSQEYDLTSFTKIALSGLAIPPEDYDLFALTADQLRALIRTRTAVGVTDILHEDDPESWVAPFDVYLSVVHPTAGTGGTTDLSVGFDPPHSFVVGDVLELSDAGILLAKAKNEAKKHKLLGGKTIWTSRSITINGRVVRVYGVMFPGNKVFEQLSEARGIAAAADIQDPTLLESGIFVATKGMPTGVTIPEGPGGAYPAYYRRCLFVVESDSVRFDMGRKSMHHAHRKWLQSAVTEVFKDFEALAPYQSPERVNPKTPKQGKTKAEREQEARERWDRYEALVNLGVPSIAYDKNPDKQEAAVAAIFHELLGSKDLKGYRPLATGYSAQYDLHAYYDTGSGDPHRLVIEFKYNLVSLVKDLENGRKNFDEIHLLVAWDADEQKLKDSGFDLDPDGSSIYAGVTHELDLPNALGVDAIPVILLRDFLKTLQ